MAARPEFLGVRPDLCHHGRDAVACHVYTPWIEVRQDTGSSELAWVRRGEREREIGSKDGHAFTERSLPNIV